MANLSMELADLLYLEGREAHKRGAHEEAIAYSVAEDLADAISKGKPLTEWVPAYRSALENLMEEGTPEAARAYEGALGYLEILVKEATREA